jgi:hypothetical protein
MALHGLAPRNGDRRNHNAGATIAEELQKSFADPVSTCRASRTCEIGRSGLEPVTPSVSKYRDALVECAVFLVKNQTFQVILLHDRHASRVSKYMQKNACFHISEGA